MKGSMKGSMNGSWTLLDTGAASAQRNMEIDAALLRSFEQGDTAPILHLYSWTSPSATYGHFIDPTHFLRAEAVQKAELTLARRPTGGGIIFHTRDFVFSILIPSGHRGYSLNPLDNYAFINALVIDVIGGRRCGLLQEEQSCPDPHARHFCMAKPTRYDVIIEGRKVGGGAQRRTKFGFLHQGSIALALPDPLLEHIVASEVTWAAMQRHTFPLLGNEANCAQIEEAREALRQKFRSVICQFISG